MFAERTYRRRVGFGRPATRAVIALMIANGAVFAVQLVLYVAWPRGSDAFDRTFALIPSAALGQARLWQFVTYSFLHAVADPFHIAFNMLMLWMFGAETEQALGRRRFLVLYFAAALFGGACMVPWYRSTMLGASGAVFGVMAVFARMFPARIVYFFLLFPMRVRTLVLFLVGADVAFGVMGASDIAHFAHVGGFAVGWFFLPAERAFGAFRARRAFRRELGRDEEESDVRARVDELLAKVAREGLGSLTWRERRFLRGASRRFRR